jgi:hypothetical protein
MKGRTDQATGLTVQQEAFCVALAKGAKSQAAAYRTAYPSSLKWKAETVHVKASALTSRDKVTARIAALRSELRAASGYDLAQAMRECDEALALAKDNENAGDMARVIALRAKMNGLLVEDRRNERPPLADLSDEDLERQLERALVEIGRAGTIH